jgi:transposase
LSIPVGTSLADVDRKLIFATMELCGGVKKRAADLLGISLKTLYNRLEEYGRHEKNMAPPKISAHRMPALIKQGDRVRIANGIFSPM